MKNFLYIALALLIILNSMVLSLVQADFMIHRERIAAAFCINLDRPDLECDGKCELDKRLDKAQEQEENRNSQVQQEILSVFTVPAVYQDTITVNFRSFPNHFPKNDSSFLSGFGFDFFHPPQA